MDREIEEKKKVLKVKKLGECIGCYSCMLVCATMVHKNFSLAKSAIAVRTSGGYQGRMVVNICRGCSSPECVEACDFQALLPRDGGGVKYKRENCTGCKACINTCVVQAITFDQEEEKVIICLQCGQCVASCPHDVIEMGVLQ
ncbi:4Fe-4S dicluster domain-containing protein [Natronincola ferrireducens]|uniref:Fe-S-cluster-containing dehydrogenase component n=1 Tax=Natronincola ferrireducens TaxID=393762 RepID=A0A1G9A2W5_9FIRM|nr:4Fe-4S dicluster domain-containing protein [Natronincola ferrireducens]SDK21587.1 Fe-S-cluster-containing dehydrogenase component [Natronincola ferrireducens]